MDQMERGKLTKQIRKEPQEEKVRVMKAKGQT